MFGPVLTLCITGAAVSGLFLPPPIFRIAGRLSRLVSLGVGTSVMGLGMVESLAAAAAAEGVGGSSLNSGTEEEARWLFAIEGGLEVKARPMGLLMGKIAGVAIAERRAASLLLALLETLECMLLTGLRLGRGEAAAGVIRGS